MELMVPADNECSLLVPRITNRNPGASGSVTIDDSRGVAVFVAKFSLSAPGMPDSMDGRRLELRSAVDDIVFAYCRDVDGSSGGSGLPGLSMFNASDQFFGVLRPDSRELRGGYSILCAQGSMVYFRGDLTFGNMNASDDRGRLLGMTETTNQQRRAVRIGPRVDAGLITLALLGIDMLDLERFSHSTPPTSNSLRN